MTKFKAGKWVEVAALPPQGYSYSYWRHISGKVLKIKDFNEDSDEVEVVDDDDFGHKTFWLPAEALIVVDPPRNIYRNQKMEEYNRLVVFQNKIRDTYMNQVFGPDLKQTKQIELRKKEREDESLQLERYFSQFYKD